MIELDSNQIGAFVTGTLGSGFGAGVAWMALKGRVATLEKRLEELKAYIHTKHGQTDARLRRSEDAQAKSDDRLARIETKIDLLLDKKI